MIDWRATINSLSTFIIGAAFGAWLVVIDRQEDLMEQQETMLRVVERQQLMTDQALQREQQMMDLIVREEKRK